MPAKRGLRPLQSLPQEQVGPPAAPNGAHLKRGREQVLMKMRLIDSKTGQLTLAWAVVGSRPSDREELHMSIGEFAATPR